MECIVANVEHMRFDIEVALDEQYGALPLPFTGMDSMFFYNIIFITVACVRLSLCNVISYLSRPFYSNLLYIQTIIYYINTAIFLNGFPFSNNIYRNFRVISNNLHLMFT